MIISECLIVKFLLSLSLLLSHCYVTVSARTFLLEAEKAGDTTGELKYRDSASNGESIYLKNGEYISIAFTTNTECTISVSNVRYSEGSAVDTATVSIDGQDIGSFRTTSSSNSGDPWNDFYDSEQIGKETTLAAGEHTIKVTVSTTDEYGMEVDYIQLSTTCENVTTREGNVSKDSITTEDVTTQGTMEEKFKGSDHSSLTSGQILGIVFGTVFAGALALTATIVTAVFIYRRRKNYVILPHDEKTPTVTNGPSDPKEPTDPSTNIPNMRH